MKTRYGYGVHSPWAYNLIENVINEHNMYYAYDDLYEHWKRSPEDMPQYGEKMDQLVFRLANYINPKFILEVGTASGVTTGYLASVSSKSRCVTIDNKNPHQRKIENNLKKFGNIEYTISNNPIQYIKDLMEQNRKNGTPLDLVHIAHVDRPDLIVETLIPYVNSNTLFIVNGINRSAKHKEWWSSIKNDPRTGVTFQFKRFGLIFFDLKMNKTHYIL
ncbi:MAG: hypothetical protein MJY71_00255 [Bacteroidaceae bacterium]|nr:hypothetical protein [Bacteroidaceae bacterium]